MCNEHPVNKLCDKTRYSYRISAHVTYGSYPMSSYKRNDDLSIAESKYYGVKISWVDGYKWRFEKILDHVLSRYFIGMCHDNSYYSSISEKAKARR